MKITYKEAKQRFIEQGRIDIELIESGYNGWSKKSLFWDIELKKEWWTITKNVYRFGYEHPDKKLEKIKKVFKEKYGFDNPSKNKNIINKIQKNRKSTKITFIEAEKRFLKQGRTDIELIEDGFTEWKNKSKFYDKVKQDYFWSIPSNVFRFKIVHPDRKTEKIQKTYTEKYNTTLRFINGSNEHLREWWRRQLKPKPSYETVKMYFDKNKTIPTEKLEKYIVSYQSHKSSLEIFIEDKLKYKHFNNKLKEINKAYRPDFKLSDKLYLNADGLYWHTEKQKGKWYHFILRKDFEKADVKILQFYDYEIYNKTEIIKSIINFKLKQNTTNLHLKDCKIVHNISSITAKSFIIKNSLKECINIEKNKHIGLYHNNELIYLLSYRFLSSSCKICYLCRKNNFIVNGSYDILLKELENILPKNIIEIFILQDLRYDFGEEITNNDFIFKKDVLSHKWTDYNSIINIKNKKHINKIYDAGQRLYIKKIIINNGN